jgi:predicted secreted Zn-dependent protease
MKKNILLAICLNLFIACAPQLAEPSKVNSVSLQTPVSTPFMGQVAMEHAQIIYYDITGATEDELRQSMNQLGPKDPYDNNRPVDAYTDWDISWNWPGYGTDNCDLTAAIVSYKIKMTVPRWKMPVDASQELIAKWEKYIQSIALHEKEHIDNIVNNYLSVKTAIESATCTTADEAAQNALVPLRKFDSDYDRATKHGATQGVVFP